MIHLILLVQKWELIDTPTSKRVFVRFSFSNFEVDIWAGEARNDGWNIFFTYPTYIFNFQLYNATSYGDRMENDKN